MVIKDAHIVKLADIVVFFVVVVVFPLYQLSAKHSHRSGMTIQLKTTANSENTTLAKCTILE